MPKLEVKSAFARLACIKAFKVFKPITPNKDISFECFYCNRVCQVTPWYKRVRPKEGPFYFCVGSYFYVVDFGWSFRKVWFLRGIFGLHKFFVKWVWIKVFFFHCVHLMKGAQRFSSISIICLEAFLLLLKRAPHVGLIFNMSSLNFML